MTPNEDTDTDTDGDSTEATAFYRCRFPDKGSGATRAHCYIEGTSEADVRERVRSHGMMRQWDASKGTVTRTAVYGYMRDDLADRLQKPGNPNYAVTTDGTVLRYDRDTSSIIETDP